jgi:hypothetical protein
LRAQRADYMAVGVVVSAADGLLAGSADLPGTAGRGLRADWFRVLKLQVVRRGSGP